MKALIFAAGEGVRMRPLTLDKPKPLIEVAGEPLLFRLLNNLPEDISEIGLVVGYKGEMIRNSLGSNWQDKPISYFEQEKQLGTWHALETGREFVGGEDSFLVLNADDLFKKEDLARLAREPRAMLAYEVEDPRRFGVIVADEEGKIIDIEEGPANPKSNLVNTGAYVFDSNIFAYRPELSSRGEYLLTEGIQKYICDYPMRAIKAEFWVPVGFPEDIARAEEILK